MEITRYIIIYSILSIIAGSITVALIGFLVGGDDIYVSGDDNETDLGLCLNYHQQNACDRVEINKIYKDICNFAANPCDIIK